VCKCQGAAQVPGMASQLLAQREQLPHLGGRGNLFENGAIAVWNVGCRARGLPAPTTQEEEPGEPSLAAGLRRAL
jgi:hypothetical protein